MRSLLNNLEEAVARQALYKSNMGLRYNEKSNKAIELADNRSEALFLVNSLVIKGSRVRQALVNRLTYLYKVRALTAKSKHKAKGTTKALGAAKMLTSINADIVELEELLIGVK